MIGHVAAAVHLKDKKCYIGGGSLFVWISQGLKSHFQTHCLNNQFGNSWGDRCRSVSFKGGVKPRNELPVFLFVLVSFKSWLRLSFFCGNFFCNLGWAWPFDIDTTNHSTTQCAVWPTWAQISSNDYTPCQSHIQGWTWRGDWSGEKLLHCCWRGIFVWRKVTFTWHK